MDQQKLCQEYATYCEELMRHARKLTGSAQDADDLVQDTFIKAYQASDSLGEDANVRAWLHRILKNLFLTKVRTMKRRETLRKKYSWDTKNGSHSGFRGETLPDVGMRRQIGHAIGQLPPPQQEVVLAIDISGTHYRRFAHEKQVPVGTVLSRLHRARNALANILVQYDVHQQPA